MKAISKIISLTLLLWVGSPMLLAQDEPPTDDLGNVSDAFQEAFFEAIKQKGIQNFEKALEALTEAMQAAKDNTEQQAAVYYQMGRNHYALKQYEQAEQAYLSSKSLINNPDITVSLYDVYYQTKDYAKAIPVVKELIAIDNDYQEDLANLYVRTQQYQEALAVLDELDAQFGRSRYRENLRKQIIQETGDSSGEIARLERNTANNPNSESDFLNLIYLYSDAGDADKAFETAKKMLELFPESELVHLALYKFYINKDQSDKAVTSMQIIMQSNTVDTESKIKVMSDFLNFANQKPQYDQAVQDALANFASESTSAKTLERIGAYYLEKGEDKKALIYFERAARLEPDNFTLLKNTLLLQVQNKKFEDALTLGEAALEIFPTQALLYLIKGVALIETGQAKEATAVLEEGMDYVIDDPTMEKDFYEQLSLAFEQLGNAKKAEEYAKKAKELG